MAGPADNRHSKNAARDIQAYGFDREDLALLSTSRHIFDGLTHPDRGGWKRARVVCAQHYGAEAAEQVLSATVDVIEAMRCLRTSAFTYGREDCACCRYKLTQEERLLIAAFHNLRRRKRSRSFVQALLLVEGTDPARLLVALEMLDYLLFELRGAC
jgi:hypothetical protein